MDMGNLPPFVIALLVAVPVLVIVIVALLVYVCCNRRYKLNWYERALLDSNTTEDHTTTSHLLSTTDSGANSHGSHGTLFSTGTASNHGRFNATPVLVPETVVEYVTVRGKMGSYPSSPLSSSNSDPSSGEWEERSKDKFVFPLPSPGSTLSPWGYRTMDHEGGHDTLLEPKRNSLSSQSTCKSDISAYVPVQPFRRFSAGATPAVEQQNNRQATHGNGLFPMPIPDDKNYTAQNRKKRSNSLIPQLAMPLTNYLKSGASSRDSSTSSLQEFSTPPLTETVSPVQVPTSVYNRRRRASMQDALDHTKINASLYQFDRPELRKQESVSSIQEDSQQGAIHISLMYDPEQSLLTVRLIQATDLVPRDFSGACDPYCRLRLLPNQKIQLQSKVKRKTRSPEFEEEFIFDVSQADITSRTLEVLLFDFDQYSRDECMGQVLVSLLHMELGLNPLALWRAILPYEDQKQIKQADMGELMFSLAYLPSAERLTVVIMKARNIKADDTKAGTSAKSLNPFIRVTITSSGKKLKKKKTSAKRTNNPIWNEALVFGISKESVKNIQVDLVVYNDSLLGNSEFLGKVVIGPKSSEEELSHWHDVINSKSALARWHHLANDDS